MKFLVLYFFIGLMFISCNKKLEPSRKLSNITIETIYEDSIAIRGLCFGEKELWFSGTQGRYGAITLDSQKVFKGKIINDTLSLDFRSIAKTKDAVFMMSVASPALLYRISNDKKLVTLVYKEENSKVFYDSMHFLNDSIGMAMGDPIDDCLNVIRTADGGKTWNKIPCEVLPKVYEGEAAFAASNTNLIFKGNTIVMVSGGKKARCFVSKDAGKTWKAYKTPIVQGESMTGIFTADFYDEKIGVVAGGNYENQQDNAANKAITTNGGKSWKLIAKNKGFGYASCIQFIPNSQGKGLVCVGGTGIHFSNDRGNTWEKVAEEKELYTIRFQNDSILYAAGKNKVCKLKLHYQ